MHLRGPALSRETSSAIWGIGLGFFVFIFMLGVGVSMSVSVIVSILSALIVFGLVLVFGDDTRRA